MGDFAFRVSSMSRLRLRDCAAIPTDGQLSALEPANALQLQAFRECRLLFCLQTL